MTATGFFQDAHTLTLPTTHLNAMAKLPHSTLASLAVSATLLMLGGCGGSSADESVAHVQGAAATPITKGMIDHWMRALAGQDFYEMLHERAPVGLVSEPADYAECASTVGRLLSRKPGAQAPGGGEISQKCHELHRLFKERALGFLIPIQWAIVEGLEHGVKVSAALLRKEFAVLRQQTYPTEADLRRYMQDRRWSLGDIRYKLKGDIFIARNLLRFQQTVERAGGEEKTYVKFALERYKGVIARTDCSPGYVMLDCKQYMAPKREQASEETVLKQLAQS